MGGYGDPSGSGGVQGVFKVDINASESSSQIPFDTAIVLSRTFASDGTNFYVAADSMGVPGIVKFNPAQVSKVPSSLFLKLHYNPFSLCYGDGYLWLGDADSIAKIDRQAEEPLAFITCLHGQREYILTECYGPIMMKKTVVYCRRTA